MDIASFCSCKDLEWHGCYGSGAKYNKYTIPESVKHPAKMSFELLERIFKHLESMGMLTPDSVVIDFMAGSGRTNVMAALRRYRTVSVELEPHFIEMIAGYDCDGKSISDFRVEPCACKSDTLHRPHKIKTGLFEVECTGNPRIAQVCRCGGKRPHKKHHVIGNRELLEQVTGRKVRWDVIQGDARELSKLLNEHGLAGVVSPPYFSQVAFQDKEFIKSIAEDKSQRYRDGRLKGHFATPEAIQRYAEKIMENYSLDPRNIGNLPDKQLAGVISPPYGEIDIGKGIRPNRWEKVKDLKGFKGRKEWESGTPSEYSSNPDNIGNLKDVPLVGVVSPPYGDLIGNFSHERGLQKYYDRQERYNQKILTEKGIKRPDVPQYSTNPANIGNLVDAPLVAVVSPPYQDTAMPMGCPAHIRKLAREGKWDEAIELEKQAEAEQAKKGNKFAVSTDETIRKKIEMALEREKGNYSENLNNIGNLPDVPLVGIMSPPYSQAQEGGGIAIQGYRGVHMHEQGKNQPDKVGQRCGYMKEVHGSDPAQIGNFPDRPLVAITSPPYANRLDGGKELSGIRPYTNDAIDTWFTERDPTNIGNLTDGVESRDGRESYLQAMLKVYQQAFLCGISPLCIVTKNPTRGGKLRDLAGDTIKLLQVCGYEIFDYHRAVLFEEQTQATLDGETKKSPKGRLSFFKRLSYAKGTEIARWEDIIFARIPMRAPESGNERAHNTPGAPEMEG